MALSQRFDRLRTGWSGYLLGVFGLAALYAFTAQIGFLLPNVGVDVRFVWPPMGLAVAFLYRRGVSFWPGIFVASFLINLELSSWWVALGIAAGSTLAPATAAGILARQRFQTALLGRTDVVGFILGGAFAPMLVSGANGAFWTAVEGSADPSEALGYFWSWWLGDALGVLVFGLPLMAANRESLAGLRNRPWGPLLGLWLVFVASLVCLGPLFEATVLRVPLVVLPALVLVGVSVRYGLPVGSAGGVLLAGVAVVATASGVGPFHLADARAGLLSLWTYLGGVTVVNLILAAVLAERDRAEVAFRTSERLFRSIVDDNPALICELDTNGVVKFVNRSYTRAVGRAVRLVGQPFLKGTTHDHAEIRKDLAALQPGTPPLTYEVLTQAHANARWHRWVVHAIGAPDTSAVIGYQAVGLDVTELRKVEDERRALEARVFESQKAESLSVIAGGMAHEFNNLLTVIVGNAELTAMTLPTDAPAHAQLQQIEQAARRATDLTRQLLAYAGKSQIHTKSTDLNLLLWEARLQRTIPAGVTLHIDACENLPKVLADESQLRHVVVNLLANALEALDGRSGAVALRTDVVALPSSSVTFAGVAELRPGPYVRFQISDTGTGMSEDVQARIFEPFFTTKFTGRGLGLAAVQGIVRSHGGAIGVRSRPGRGTALTVLLPAEVGDARVAEPRQVALVIDADDGDCVPGHRALADLNWEVVFATDGPSGVALFRQSPDRFGLVLVGLSPSASVETETLEKLRGIRAQVPLLICARLTEYSLPDLTSFHPAAFLLKPYGTDDVREAIERVKNSRTGRVNNGH